MISATPELEDALLARTPPPKDKKAVDAAGVTIARLWDAPSYGPEEAAEFDRSWELMNRWRAAHNFPLNTFQTTLREKAKRVHANAIVAQRIKRTVSIVDKLQRYPSISLSKMQDIGGCRAIVGGVDNVFKLRDLYLKSQLRHRLIREKNYIVNPKDSGYRGIHLVYCYISDRSKVYNGLQVEMQLRSGLQHAWATAVETAGTFIAHSLKSSKGPDEWLEFFALVSSAFAIMERQPTVPYTPTTKSELRAQISERAERLQVDANLRNFTAATNFAVSPAKKGSHYFLLELRPDRKVVMVTDFPINKLPEANAAYAKMEQRIAGEKVPGVQAVLVSVDRIESLKKAYPNFYLDTTAFLEYLKQVLAWT